MLSKSGVKPTGFQSIKQSFQDYPAAKRIFLCEAGGTHSATDIIDGTKLDSQPWTLTSSHSSYMQVADEIVHHNIDLASGSWPQIGRNSCIWMIAGKFAGRFSFGFGDSTPNNRELVFSADATPTPVLLAKFNSNQSISFPNIGEGLQFPAQLDSSVTSLCGLIVNEESGLFEFFITDANGDYVSVTRPISDYANYVGCNFPATYSIGRDVVTSANPEGIVDLSLIGVFKFENGIPDSYVSDLEQYRSRIASGIKVPPSNWEGLS